MKEPELKPCPFCGSKDIEIWQNKHLAYTEYRVCCMVCHITQAGQYYYTERDAVDAWNSRAGDERNEGEWKLCFEDWRHQIEGDECSACGFQHYGTSIGHYHYCPNCGAKMKGGEE